MNLQGQPCPMARATAVPAVAPARVRGGHMRRGLCGCERVSRQLLDCLGSRQGLQQCMLGGHTTAQERHRRAATSMGSKVVLSRPAYHQTVRGCIQGTQRLTPAKHTGPCWDTAGQLAGPHSLPIRAQSSSLLLMPTRCSQWPRPVPPARHGLYVLKGGV